MKIESSIRTEYNSEYSLGNTTLSYKEWLEQKISIYAEQLEIIERS